MARMRSIAFSFKLKLILGLVLVGVADLFFWMQGVGWTAGGFALLCIGAVAVAAPAVWRNRTGAVCLAFAVLMALAAADNPNLLALALWWLALSAAVLTSRRAQLASLQDWILRLAWHGLVSAIGPLLDLAKVRTYGGGVCRLRILRLAVLLILPLFGGAVFLILFSAANPLISQALANLQFVELDRLWALRGLFWLVVFWTMWSLLRPRQMKRRLAPASAAWPTFPVPPAASLVLSLAVFNALFLLENGLDTAFLWSGARLPQGMTLADYAHRGAYPLIATALLAGGFVLAALRPGSQTARMPLVRWLLIAWVAQNVFLVASSMLRILDYIEAYSLTRMRIAALLWMGLVALGLILILWRMLRNRSARWLVWSNAAALLAVLAVASIVDTGEIAANWNVRHAREIGGAGAELDWAYLDELGPSALPAYAWLERHARDPALRSKAAACRDCLQGEMQARQLEWRTWTWRTARRLAAAGPLDETPAPLAARASAPPDATVSTRPAGS